MNRNSSRVFFSHTIKFNLYLYFKQTEEKKKDFCLQVFDKETKTRTARVNNYIEALKMRSLIFLLLQVRTYEGHSKRVLKKEQSNERTRELIRRSSLGPDEKSSKILRKKNNEKR